MFGRVHMDVTENTVGNDEKYVLFCELLYLEHGTIHLFIKFTYIFRAIFTYNEMHFHLLVETENTRRRKKIAVRIFHVCVIR